MSDIFEKDIDTESEDLSSLEDNYESDSEESKSFVFPSNLYKVKLVYSFEGIYVTPPEGKKLNAGESVIVPTRYGLDLALVMGESKVPVGIKPSDVVQIERVATEDDLEKAEKYKQTEKDAFNTFREKVSQHHLDMKLVAVHFLVGEPKALFFFSSDNRVDFRELVKDLVSIFKMRIELRQIGVRDESRITGGLGVCGRPYCCNCVSDKLRPVSIRMAKDQNLSLNSMKISGQCGRLLCCLSYEYDWYAEARKKLPNEGIKLFYDGTNFRVSEVNLITSMVKMMGEDGRFLEVNASRFVKDGNRWKIN
ncbi:MAG: regulatory iron-sulfur-containing complex subunit RicT [Treponema sp.]|nr:regulatory iron-sulfur-containing complex subunit RicT [Treponema sp.]MDY3757867.1 regulatory iron-sulfur-containing complex subunit RicT [Treponema sp.]MDY5838243.1 regulatory iron-sulfur-containing complex subunit RicT [Treponema sp.]MEE0893830.1 regulatory iron-sulfur-containing complex subunit RicT [Treponema sp.]